MSEIADAKINSFAHVAEQANVSPSEEPIFVLTGSQLQEIITRAIQSLQDRIDTLEERTIRQDEKTAVLERTQDIQADNELNMLRLIADLREPSHKEPVNSSPLIDELYNHMNAVGLKQTTFANAAKILKVTKMRVLQIKAAIALDQRFIILPSESHKQRLLIRLKDV